MQKVHTSDNNHLVLLVNKKFQDLFHSTLSNLYDIHLNIMGSNAQRLTQWAIRLLGLFHLSLTVLVRYRSFNSIQAQRASPPFFRQSFTCSVLLILFFIKFRLRYRAFTFYGTVFQSVYHLSRNKIKRRLLRVHSPLLTESRLMFFP